MSSLVPAIFRTGVPIIYAILIKLGLGQLGLPDAVVTDAATVLLSVLLYAALRGLETIEPRLGVLLGWIGQPDYSGVADEDLEKWRSATKAEVEQALAAVKSDILDALEQKFTKTGAAANTKKTAAKKATAAKSTRA